jgi:hypothetical protein
MDQVIENVGRRSKDNWSEAGMPPDVGENSLNGFERNVLFQNQGGGKFIDVGYATGSNRIEDGRGVAVADFDRDGRLDLLLQNLEKPAVLLMGRGKAGNWLQLSLEGTESNRGAIGAIATVRIGDEQQLRQVSAGSGFLSSSSPILHFGLGDATSVDSLEIRWPSGRTTEISGVQAGHRYVIRETTGDSVPLIELVR